MTLSSQLPLLVEFLGVVGVTMLLTLSPSFKKSNLGFKYPRREAILSLVLVALLAGGLWLIFTRLPLSLPQKVNKVFTFPIDQIWPYYVTAVVIALVFIIPLLGRGQPWRSAGISRQNLRPSLQLGLALAVICIFLGDKIYTLIEGINSSEINFLLAVLALGFAEEFGFRGYVQPRLSAWVGDNWGWIVTAVLFTLWHIPEQILITKATTLPALGIGLLDLLVFGLIEGWIMRKCNNIVAPALYHAFHFFVLFI